MKELREMTKAEVKALDGKMVISVYSDFEEKINGCETKYDKKPFAIIALSIGKWYTDDSGLYISYRDYTTCNGKVTVTHIFKAA